MEQTLTNNSKLILSIWHQPRKAIHLLLENEKPFFHFKIIFFLTFIFSMQFLAFLWVGNLWSIVTELNNKTNYITLLSFIFIIIGSIIVTLNLTTLILHFFVQTIGGIGKFIHTKSVVYWSSLTTIPIGLVFVIFIWSGEANIKAVKQGYDYPLFTACLQCLAALAFLILILYTLIILSKMLSEIHKISGGRAFVTVLFSVISTFTLVPLILKTAIHIFS